jgi:ABC-type branched-subunit amino acid transport system ATPase component
LVVHYGGVAALDNVDLSVGAGEFVGLVGANGAGKTTLLDCLSGHVKPAHGRVWLGESEITRLGPGRRARQGVMRSFQDARLFPTMPVFDVLLLTQERVDGGRRPLGRGRSALARGRAKAVQDLASRMELEPLLARLVGELSTGERKRLDLACAVGLRAPVLLLDEPSAGLASADVPPMAALLRQAAAASGAAIVMVEHDLPLVWDLVDRVVILDNGTVVAAGPPEALRGHPVLSFGRLA